MASPRTKRGFDLVVAGGALILLAPAALVAALALQLERRGPMFHASRRLGRQRRAERRGDGGRRVHDAGGTLFVRRRFRVLGRRLRVEGRRPGEHPQLTRVGRVLRRTGLERWPELLAVLAGRMSMVGPRPATLDFRDCQQRYCPSWTLGAARLRPGFFVPAGRRRSAARTLMARLLGDRLHDEEYARRLREAGPLATLRLDLRVMLHALRREPRRRVGNDGLRVDYPERFVQLAVDVSALSRSTPNGLGAEVLQTEGGFTTWWYPARRPAAPRAGWRAQVLDELADRWAVDEHGALSAEVAVSGLSGAGEDRLEAELPAAPDDAHLLVDHLAPVFESLARAAHDERLGLRLGMLLLEALLGCDPAGGASRVALELRVDRRAVRFRVGALDEGDAAASRARARPARLVALLQV